MQASRHWLQPLTYDVIKLSIIICCYNSATRLPKTLSALKAQSLTPSAWELIIIDNASTDDTAKIAMSLWGEFNPVAMRVLYEKQPGLSHARQRGVHESSGDIVVFVDDDNWLEPQWLNRLLENMENHPSVAICGGFITGVYEKPPEKWFESVKVSWAIGRPGGCREGIQQNREVALFGAGLGLRRLALNQLEESDYRCMLADRRGNDLSSGGDTELCHAITLLGWQTMFDSSMRMKHYMPADRLHMHYAERLFIGSGSAMMYLYPYRVALRGQRLSMPKLCIVPLVRALVDYIVLIFSARNEVTKLKKASAMSRITGWLSYTRKVENTVAILTKLKRGYDCQELLSRDD